MKEKLLEIVNRKVAELLAEVEALEESPSEEVEQLRLQLQAEKDKVVALEAKLLEVDSAVKAVDALIEDAPVA